MAEILILNGPNLNLLGIREPMIYGAHTLDSLNEALSVSALSCGHSLITFQSNAEHELMDTIQQTSAAFIIFNPAAFTHTSVALRDALLAVEKPFIEVHLSNIQRREPFRHFSYFADIAIGSIVGLGTQGYFLALQYAHYFCLHKEP